MPELPEVETIKTQLNKSLTGLVFNRLEMLDKKAARFVDSKSLQKIIGVKIKRVKRRAKILLLEFNNNYCLVFHLKMTGQIILNNSGINYLPNKHTRLILYFSKQKKIYFQDLRKFGWVKILYNKNLDSNLLNHILGPEPFDKSFSLEYFSKELGKTKKPIKTFLLDQTKIAGIGNIYANEALFVAKIYPGLSSNKLNERQIKKLHQAIKKVLAKGIELKGASDQDYLDAHGNKGEYQKHFLVYKRKGENCKFCKKPIKRIALGGRGTFYCSQCQRI